MANEDKTRQITVDGQVLNELLNAVRDLSTRYTNQEERLSSVEQIILARLNDTRPFEKQMAAQLNEMNAKIIELSVTQAAILEEQAAMRQDLTALRKDYEGFRVETNENFRLINKQMGILSQASLKIHAEYELLEERVSHFETARAR